MFWPSMKPSSRSPWWIGWRTESAGFAGGEKPPSQPITGIAFCCARGLRDAAIVTVAISSNSRRLIGRSPLGLFDRGPEHSETGRTAQAAVDTADDPWH